MVTATPMDMRDMLGVSAPIPTSIEVELGQRIKAAELDAAAKVVEDEALVAKFEDLARVVRAGGTVTCVDEDVAHAQELGRREIRRRRARRKAERKIPGPPNPPKADHHRPVG